MRVKKMSDDVRQQENDAAEAVRKMMDQWQNGDLTDAQDTFNTVMGQKADALISGRKAEIASTMFNNAVEDGSTLDGLEDYENPTADEVETETETEEENEEV